MVNTIFKTSFDPLYQTRKCQHRQSQNVKRKIHEMGSLSSLGKNVKNKHNECNSHSVQIWKMLKENLKCHRKLDCHF